MQVFNRHSRGMVKAEQDGDQEAFDRHCAGMERAATREDELVQSKARATKGMTKAGEYTMSSTEHMSDEELTRVARANAGDPELVDNIYYILDQRAEHGDKFAEVAEAEREQIRDWGPIGAYHRFSRDPGQHLAGSPIRRLTPDQQCREDYDLFVHSSFLSAEYETAGNMLTQEGRAKGIDPVSLFSGPYFRVTKYASEELKSWFRDHGRRTYESFRAMYLGRDGDRQALIRSNLEDYGDVA